MINKIILQGRLTADPELKKTQSGVSVCSFTIAWSEKRNDTELKCFMRCTAWRGMADFLSQYFRKGQQILIEGKILTREFTDNDGNNRYVLETTVESIHFCGSKSSNNTPSTTPEISYNQNTEDFTAVVDEDDLPFF